MCKQLNTRERINNILLFSLFLAIVIPIAIWAPPVGLLMLLIVISIEYKILEADRVRKKGKLGEAKVVKMSKEPDLAEEEKSLSDMFINLELLFQDKIYILKNVNASNIRGLKTNKSIKVKFLNPQKIYICHDRKMYKVPAKPKK